MILSCALFAGATHAWFSDRCSAQITLQSATFDVEVVVTTPEGGTPEISTENGVYVCNLNSGTYEVTLTRRGSASVGYCEISVGNDVYYSQNLSAQTESLSFTLVITRDNVPVTFTPKWSNAEQPQSTLGDTISYPAGSRLLTMSGAEPEPDEPAEPETGGSDNGTGDPAQPETNNPTVENSETGEGSTGSSNSTETEPEEKTGAEGTTSEGETGAGGTSEGASGSTNE